MLDLTGRVAVVTGAASGIGKGLAERFAAETMRVALGDVDAMGVAEVAKMLEGSIPVSVDVTDPASVEAFAEETTRQLGPVNVVCANAGIIGAMGRKIWETEPADWERTIAVNLYGVVNTLRAFVPRLVPGDSHVVITGSMASITMGSTLPQYFASKHAVLSVAETLRLQFAEQGIATGVSVLLPAAVHSNLRFALPDHDKIAEGLVGGAVQRIPASDVAERAVQAIRTGRFYVCTHPEARRRVEAHVEEILDAFDQVPR